MLRWIFRKWEVSMEGVELAQDRGRWLEAETCECRNEPSGSIKCREFLD
jgi:hypothetical protein